MATTGKKGPSRDRIDAVAEAWDGQDPDLMGPDVELTKRLARLHVLLQDVLVARLRPYALTKAEYDILSTLRSMGRPFRLHPGELSNRILMTSGGTSNVLRRLESRELITRESDAHDRRSAWVQLTPRGAELAVSVVRSVVAAHRQALTAASPASVIDASTALKGILVALGDSAPQE
jgi:DNA-binding MarR family transcriptional regulator